MEQTRWRRCSVCKQDIAFRQVYWVCSVSTCNRPRTGLAFCSTSCWDAHVPVMRHRDAWAVEERAPAAVAVPAPSKPAPPELAPAKASSAASRDGEPRRAMASAPPKTAAARPAAPREVLIVASKLKQYIRAISGMNTSDAVASALSDHVRALCEQAVENARHAERKTVLERDVPAVPKPS